MTLDEQCEQITGEVGASEVITSSYPLHDVCHTLLCRKPSLPAGQASFYSDATLDFTSCGPKHVIIFSYEILSE